jgi:hypothetical protein
MQLRYCSNGDCVTTGTAEASNPGTGESAKRVCSEDIYRIQTPDLKLNAYTNCAIQETKFTTRKAGTQAAHSSLSTAQYRLLLFL